MYVNQLRQLTSSKTGWTWNATYQKLFVKAKSRIREDVCMKCYDGTQPLYLGIDVSRIGLGSCSTTNQKQYKLPKRQSTRQQHPQTPAFAGKSLSNVERIYSNIQREALGILHSLEKLHHYCFVREVSIITDHKPLVANLQKMSDYAISENTMNSPQNTSVQSKNNIQTWTRSICSRLALYTKPLGKQRRRNTWHAVEC